MRICVFTRSLPAHQVGGMEIHAEALIDGFLPRGHQVSVITTAHPEGKEKEDLEGGEISYLKGTPAGKYSRAWWRKSEEKFRQLCKENKFDLIYSESAGAYSYLSGKMREKYNLPVVVGTVGTARGEIRTKLNQGLSLRTTAGIAKNFFYYWKDRRLLPLADALIVCSEQLEKQVLREYPVQGGKVFYVPLGIDVEKFNPGISPVALRQNLGIKNNEKVILFSSRLKKEKGIHLLLKVFPTILENCKDVRLVIVGSGEFEHKARIMVEKNKIKDRVLFTGSVDYADLPRYYSLADIFVFPTIRVEGLPYTILEVMACGKPIIASRIGGIPSAIESDREGILFNPGDTKELQERIMTLLKNPEKRRALGQQAREKVLRNFTREKMIDETLAIFEQVIKESKC